MNGPAPVSVVITCFNLEQFIAEAIQSVIGQEYAGEVQIVVVDDCSTDRSPAIIGQFAQAEYVRTAQNGGVLLAMLTGLERAKHDIVCLLDGDDIWLPGKVAAVVSQFQGNERTALVVHDLDYADAEGNATQRPTSPDRVLTAAAPSDRPRLVRTGILQTDDYVWLGSALCVRRSVGQLAEFSEWARQLPDPVNTYQDWPLAFWVAALGGVELDYVPRKLFRYRLHSSNYSGDAGTAAKALRNLRRTRNTLRAMAQLAVERELPMPIRQQTAERARFLDYLVNLYSGRRLSAFRGWFGSLGFLKSQGLVTKELVRLCAIQLVGPRLFSRLAKRGGTVAVT